MNNKLMDVTLAFTKLNGIKKALEELQAGGWAIEIINKDCSFCVSDGTIFVKAFPKDKTISAD